MESLMLVNIIILSVAMGILGATLLAGVIGFFVIQAIDKKLPSDEEVALAEMERKRQEEAEAEIRAKEEAVKKEEQRILQAQANAIKRQEMREQFKKAASEQRQVNAVAQEAVTVAKVEPAVVEEQKEQPAKEVSVAEETPVEAPVIAEPIEQTEQPAEPAKEVAETPKEQKKSGMLKDKTIAHLVYNKETDGWDYKIRKSGNALKSFATEEEAMAYVKEVQAKTKSILIFKQGKDGLTQSLKK